MSVNIIKLISISLLLTLVMFFIGMQLSPIFLQETQAITMPFAWSMGIGTLIGALATGIFLLIKPYYMPIRKQTLFVGNLAFKASDRELRRLFSEYGEVFSIRLMTDKVTRKPRGYGFIEMDQKGAELALEQLNEEEFMGRELRVSHANEPSRSVD